MTFRKRISSLLTLGLLAGFSTIGLAQEPQEKPKGEGQRQRTDAGTITGCLAKGDAAGQYILTDSKSGSKITVTPSAGVELDQHAANHTVKLTGSKGTGGTFTATKVEHVSATCATEK